MLLPSGELMICVGRPAGASGSSPARAGRSRPVSASFTTFAPAEALGAIRLVWGASFQVTVAVSASLVARWPFTTPVKTSDDAATTIARVRT
jgi:hypothetical protein